MEQQTITASHHGLRVGDIVEMSWERRRWRRLWRLIVHPRAMVVVEVTGTIATIEERRMTWSQWWWAIRRSF